MSGWFNIASVAGEKVIELRLVMALLCRRVVENSVAVGELA